MMCESLGDNCEFGLVQRHFKAEPLGLLRWATGTTPVTLAAMLESRLDGIGEKQNMLVSLHKEAREYFAGDVRFFTSHTFIRENEQPEPVIREKLTRRTRYLKDKMVQDMTEGEKIFVYRPMMNDLPVEDGLAIARAMTAQFPSCRLMLMRVAPSPELVGKVAPVMGNVVWGFLTRFSIQLCQQFYPYAEWLSACRNAAAYYGAAQR